MGSPLCSPGIIRGSGGISKESLASGKSLKNGTYKVMCSIVSGETYGGKVIFDMGITNSVFVGWREGLISRVPAMQT